MIKVYPILADPIAALEGKLEGTGITKALIEGRQKERKLEAQKKRLATSSILRQSSPSQKESQE